MNPYPAKAGANATTYGKGTQSGTISSGTWTATTSLFGVVVNTNNGSVCDLVPSCPCPCPSGDYTTILSIPVPWYALSDSYTGTFNAVDGSGKVITCLTYQFDIVAE